MKELKEYFQEVKEYRKREKQKKKEDKALLKRLEKEEEELELDQEEANDDFNIKIIIDAVKNDPELDEELASYLTEEEKETMRETKKEGKRLTIIIAASMSVFILAAVIAMLLLSRTEGGTALEVLTPKIENYLENELKSSQNIVSIEQVEYRTEEDYIKDSTMYVATTTNNNHIVTFEDNEIYADDIKIDEVYKDYKEHLKTIKGDYKIISSSPTISHQDFYFNYNLQTEYIKVLPHNKSFDELLNSNKLTITDMIMYQGNINFQDAKSIMDKLSTDSKLIFIKNEKGFPVAITFISHTEYFTLKVLNTLEPIHNINYYELDTSFNKIVNFKISKINNNRIETEENYKISNAYEIEYDNKSSHTPDGKEKAEYFFISMDKSLISNKDLIIFDTYLTSDNTYQEESIYDYPFLYMTNIGGRLYIVGNSKMGIANKTKQEESFLCKIGLC